MSEQQQLSRREFLRLASLAASGVALAACAPPATPVAPEAGAGPAAAPAPEAKTLVLAIQGFAHDAMRPGPALKEISREDIREMDNVMKTRNLPYPGLPDTYASLEDVYEWS